MTMDHAAHAGAVLCHAVIAGAGCYSLYAIRSTIRGNWSRMVAAYHGQSIPPAASATLHVAHIPQRRGVEAAATPAFRGR